MRGIGRQVWVCGWVFFLLLGATPVKAQDLNLIDFVLPSPLNRWCRYVYVTPAGFPGFTLRFAKLTSGKYAGKYRYGDWVAPDPKKTKFMIVDWDNTHLYLYADNNGDFPEPVSMPMVYALNTKVPHPSESGIYWYLQLFNNMKTPWGTFDRVALWIVLDSAYPPNAMNTKLGLNPSAVPYGVTGLTWYAPGLGEIRDVDVDAATGNTKAEYILQSTGIGFPSSVPLQLLLHQ